MEPRLKELLERMTAPGPFPNMSASEGHELVELVYGMAEATDSAAPSGQAEFALLDGQRLFTMTLEPHTPADPGNACKECVLAHGPMCMNRSYCEYPKTEKTWKRAI